VREWEEWVEPALDDFAGDDERRAQRAFERLRDAFYADSCRYASSLKTDDQDEAVQEAWVRIWMARERFKPQGPAAFLAYLKLTVTRCALDIIRRKRREVETDEPIPEREFWGLIQELIDDPEVLEMAIGETWFKYSPQLTQLERNKRVLAVRLRMLHKKTLQQVRNVLREPEASAATETLEAWCQDLPVLRDLSYRVVFHNGKELAAAILGARRDPAGRDLEPLYQGAILKKGEPPSPWTWPEVASIIERYAFGLAADHVEKRNGFPFAPIGVRCLPLYPFTKCMKVLARTLGENRVVLGEIDLWKRLAFQYWYGEEITQKEIMERLEEPAMEGGYRLTAGTLNVWFGNRRLLDQLQKNLQKRQDDGL